MRLHIATLADERKMRPVEEAFEYDAMHKSQSLRVAPVLFQWRETWRLTSQVEELDCLN